MKRTCLISSSLALAVLAPTVASAEPAILYIPTDPVTLTPFNTPPCGSGVSAALGCANVAEVLDRDPFTDAAGLTTDMDAALMAYDVLVTNTRPPEYISYVMLMASDAAADMSTSFTCTSAGINCAARQRDDIAFTSGTTMNCMDPEPLHAALHAFGRVSGLEGVDNPDDFMNYIPDYTTPPMGFLDVCSDRVQQQGFNDAGDQVSLPLECTSVDHFTCPDGMNGDAGQNSHQDLLAAYGDRVEDVDAPVLSNILPEDGSVLMADGATALLEIDVDIEDADPVVGVRWTITSDALVSDMFPDGVLSICTNDVCSVNWPDALPLKETGSDWASPVALNFPPGEYAITLEAADYHGNVAETVSLSVTIEGMGGGTGGATGNADTTAGNDTNPPLDTGLDGSSGGDDTSGSAGGTDDGGGCSCRTNGQAPGSMVLMLLGFAGLGAMRRRW